MLIVWPEGSGCVQKPEDLDPLKKIGKVDYYDSPPKDKEELLARLENAEAVYLDYSIMDAEVIEKCSKLKFICFLGVGYSNCIDMDAANKKGVVVAYTPGYGANSVAEFTLGLILGLTRHIGFAYLSVKNGAWEPNKFPGIELKGKKLGIVGLGPIGMQMARLGAAMEMEVLAWTRNPDDERAKYGLSYVSLEELFANADIVSIHLAYSDQTERMVSASLLERMKAGAYFVNTARAKIVDNDALYGLLKEGRIAGAALDVHEEEPAPKGYRMLDLPNVLICPHMAYNTAEAGENMLRIAIATLEAYMRGERLHVVSD
jgi:phosphoglycerate dehydrogenase-like enzyme